MGDIRKACLSVEMKIHYFLSISNYKSNAYQRTVKSTLEQLMGIAEITFSTEYKSFQKHKSKKQSSRNKC